MKKMNNSKKVNPIIHVLREGNKEFEPYKHLIGIGVILTLISFSIIFYFALEEERDIAEKCGYTDGKLKCVCTEAAYNQFLNASSMVGMGTINISGNFEEGFG